MAKNSQLATATVNGQATDLANRLNNGYLRIYGGTQPGDADTAVASQPLLVELRFAATAAAGVSGGVVTFNPLSSAVASGNGAATWFRALRSDGSTVVMDGSVGVANANLNLSDINIASGAAVSLTGFTHSVAKATTGF